MPDEGTSFDVSEMFDDATAPPAATDPPAIDPAEINTLKEQLQTLTQKNQALESWKADTTKAFSGTPEPNQTEEWAATLMDPGKFDSLIDNKVNQRLAEKDLRSQYQTEHQDLAWAEPYVLQDASRLAMQDVQSGGQFKGDKHYVDQAIEQFKSKMPSHSQPSNSQLLKTMALDMGTGSSSGEKKPVDFWSMPNAKFEEMDHQIAQRLRNT